ncbi:MAG TPA: MinD/ParA family protein, partial [Spongiibacteraceae bacterium]|nr:MinD/ParA family protein [Spongiibacteraceae bacterium]
AIQRQRAVVDMAPRSKAGLAFHSLAEKVDKWPLPSSPRGHLEFFVERLVQPATAGS